mgnify:CR=1 FL=1
MTKLETTPIGTLSGFVALETPSFKFDEDGIYSCKMLFEGKNAVAMKEKIDSHIEDANIKNKSKLSFPYEIDENEKLIVRFKQKGKKTSINGEVYEYNIKFFNSKAEEITTPLDMGEGSKIKIAYTPYVWNSPGFGVGCTMQPVMVQVIELVKFSRDDNPFDTVADGFIGEDNSNAVFLDNKEDDDIQF